MCLTWRLTTSYHWNRNILFHTEVVIRRFCNLSYIFVAALLLTSSICTSAVCVICSSTNQSPLRPFYDTTKMSTTGIIFSSEPIWFIEHRLLCNTYKRIFINLYQIYIVKQYMTSFCIISRTIYTYISLSRVLALLYSATKTWINCA